MLLQTRPEAETDLIDAAVWYDCRRIGDGGRFVAAYKAAIAILMTSPRAGTRVRRSVSGREVRWFLLGRFPYIVHYEVTANEIVILSVTDARRRGHPWRQRL